MLRTFGLASALVIAGLATPAVAEEHYVLMMGNGYFPISLHSVPGDTVRFINMSVHPMTATADDGTWDTGVLQQNEEFVLTVTDGMMPTYSNSVLDNIDQYGAAVGLNAMGVIEYTTPANVTVNTLTSN